MSRPYGTRAASAAEAGQIDPTNGVPTADPAIVATPTHTFVDVAGRGMASIGVRSSGNLCEGEEYA